MSRLRDKTQVSSSNSDQMATATEDFNCCVSYYLQLVSFIIVSVASSWWSENLSEVNLCHYCKAAINDFSFTDIEKEATTKFK